MTVEGFLLIALFLVLLVLPLVPGTWELLRPRDDRPLDIDLNAAFDPREPGRSFREGLRPLLVLPEGRTCFRGPVDPARPGGDVYEVWPDLVLPPDTRSQALVLVLGKVDVGERARLAHLYAHGDGRLAAGVRLRALAADGDVALGPECVIEEWLDVEGTAHVGPRCALGHSASAARTLHLGSGCTFRRLWGLPIATEATQAPVAPATAADEMAAQPPQAAARQTVNLDDTVIWAGRQLTIPRGLNLDRDLVVHGAVLISAGNRVRGSIKAHGGLHLADGVEIEGNLICRRSIQIDGRARIRGNVFAEGDIVIGPGTRIGQADAFKSVYALGRVELAADVQVFGRIFTERAGVVTVASGGAKTAPPGAISS